MGILLQHLYHITERYINTLYIYLISNKAKYLFLRRLRVKLKLD